MINFSDVQNSMEEMKRNQLLEKHPYKIWEGNDGKWRTYLPDDSKKDGRRMIKRNNLKDVENAVIKYVKIQTENPTVEDVFHEWNDRRAELGKISKPTQ